MRRAPREEEEDDGGGGVPSWSCARSRPRPSHHTPHTHQAFFAAFPEYASSDIYLAGESYAGQYIPNIATHLLDPAGGAYDDIGARLKVGRRRRRRVAVARAIAVGREGEGE